MEAPSFLDRVVETVARGLDGLGFNGTRLRWRWNRRRREMQESGARASILWRSASTPHKMCPACRALVPRSASTCSACGESLAGVPGPGVGRLIANVIPGASAATSLILLINGGLFVLMLMATISNGRGGGLFAAFDGLTLIRFGSGFSPLTVGAGEWWRLVTPIFLHGGLLHFAFNSYALVQLGPLVEGEYHAKRFLILYVLTGIAGNVASQVVWPGVRHTVGASGAICGLIGVLLAYGMRRGGAFGGGIRASMTRTAIYLLVFSLLPGIDLLCHIGGFIAGFGLGWIVPSGPVRTRAAAAGWNALFFAAIGLILWSFWQAAQHASDAVGRFG